MLIHPACGARASGRAPASRLMQNFGAIFCVPAAAIVGTKLIALLVIGLQAAFSMALNVQACRMRSKVSTVH